MAKNGIGAGSLILGIILGGALGFGLVFFFPPAGTVVQTKYFEWKYDGSPVQKQDSDLTNTSVVSPNLNVTTLGSSYLVVEFLACGLVRLDIGFTGTLMFTFSLTIDDVTAKNAYVIRQSSVVFTSVEESTEQITMKYVSSVLPAGNHTIDVLMMSTADVGGSNAIYLALSSYRPPRTLTIQEIRA